jgi:hypothetical protein
VISEGLDGQLTVEEILAQKELILANARHRLVCRVSGDRVGCVGDDGEVKIPFVYNKAIRFSESGFALAYGEEGAVYINADHSRVLKSETMEGIPDAVSQEFSPDEYRTSGYARVREGDLIGYMNGRRELVIPPQFHAAYLFQDGRALVCVGCHPRRWSANAPEEAHCTGDAFYINESGQRLDVEPELPPFEDCEGVRDSSAASRKAP